MHVRVPGVKSMAVGGAVGVWLTLVLCECACIRSLMMELLFGYVSIPAWVAELMLELLLAVGWAGACMGC